MPDNVSKFYDVCVYALGVFQAVMMAINPYVGLIGLLIMALTYFDNKKRKDALFELRKREVEVLESANAKLYQPDNFDKNEANDG